MVDYYFDAYYILLEKNCRIWDPRLCHWSIFDIIINACVYGPHDDLLTWMYKHSHDSLMRYLIDVHLYDVVMYFHDLYFVLMMFIRVKYKQWGPGIAWFHITWSSTSIVGLRKKTNLQLFEFIFAEQCSCFLCGVPF